MRDLLLAAGMWPVLRARPFGHVAAPDGAPAALFVTAIDTTGADAGNFWIQDARGGAYSGIMVYNGNNETITFSVGDKLTVTGSRPGGGKVLIARELKRGTVTLQLRDEKGVPIWTGLP